MRAAGRVLRDAPRSPLAWLASAAAFASVLAASPAGADARHATRSTQQGQTHLLIVAGIGGEKAYADLFYEWGAAMADAATARAGIPAGNVTFLAEDPARDPARIDGKSTRQSVEQALVAAATLGSDDHLYVLLLGHGSQQGDAPRFNLPGPDLAAADFARLLGGVKARVTFVNAASASGEFIKALSGPRRTVVTATKSGMEKNAAIFGKFFVAAYAVDGADADKDGRVSVLEAFDYARREVAREYESRQHLQSEHALLDDNGDGVGSAELKPPGTDGAQARGIFLTAGVAAVASNDPRVAVLAEEKRRIEGRIEALKQRKAQMDATAYEAQLEELLLELARTNKAIRDAAGGKP